MTKLEQLKAAYEAATPGEWRPCREHEAFDGPMFDIDDDERQEYESRPFVRICAAPGNVTTNHDLFVFKPGNAELIALAHNTIPLLLEAVELLRSNHKLLGQVLDSTCYGLDEGQQGTDNATSDLLEKLK